MPTETASLSLIKQRRIEAQIVGPIYAALKREVGAEAAKRVIGDAIRSVAIDAGKEFARALKESPSLSAYGDGLSRWTEEDAMQIEVLHQSERRLDFNVRRCRFAEMYAELGLSEIGDLLSCNRDGAFCEGFDARLKLRRTQTIMGGAPLCDFRYAWDEAE